MSTTIKVKNTPPPPKKGRWAAIVIPICLLVLVLVVAGFLLIPSLVGDQSSPQKVVEKYYGNMYAGDLSLLSQCLPQELREKFEQVSTLGGVSSNIYLSYRQQAAEQVGENMQASVKLLSNENAGSDRLTALRGEHPKATMANAVTFQLVLTGSKGSVTMEGTTDVVKIGNQWYLTDYNLVLDRVA